MSSPDALDHIVVKPRRFQCPRCQRRFARLEHLQRHERTHTQERPFLCSQCDSRFTRSDLLIRHTRLSHNRGGGKTQTEQARAPTSRVDPPPHSRGVTGQSGTPSGDDVYSQHPDAARSPPPTPSSSLPSSEEPTGSPSGRFQSQTPHISPPPTAQILNQDGNCLRATLSLAPEPMCLGAALDASAASGVHHEAPTAYSSDAFVGSATHLDIMPESIDMGDSRLPPILLDMDESFDGFTTFLEADTLSTPNFMSLVAADQHDPPFLFDALPNSGNTGSSPNESGCTHLFHGQGTLEELSSISRFGSRLPSVQPNEVTPDLQSSYNHHQAEIQPRPAHRKRLSHVSHEDRHLILLMVAEFDNVLPTFQLPTALSLARYIRAYINGFHEHLPFLHIPSMSIQDCSVELILALAAVGAQYCFEAERGVELFHAARAIATERIRRRDARMASEQREYEIDHNSARSARSSSGSPIVPDRAELSHVHTVNGPLGLPSNPESSTPSTAPEENLMQSAQALLILMAMATWANHREILREALAIQSILASIVRDDGLHTQCLHDDHGSWEEWIHCETVLRTKYIVFCFFNLHCIVYDIPPLIVGSEVKMRLPCSAAEFKAETVAEWQGASLKANKTAQFQDALRRLFYSGYEDVPERHSSLGNYILIHAIIQQVLLVRQAARCRFDSSELTGDDVATLEHALRRWQLGWESDPESSLDPRDPNGPVAFNSTALLSLAYIRLHMDTGPGRALSTRDPVQIANALRDAPTIKGTPRLVRALLHSAHALSIPIKIGIRLVAKTQTFIWSIQHSLCSLECALLLSKWLAAVSAQPPNANPPTSEDERRVISIVKAMLDETEFAIPPVSSLDLQETAKYLNVGVLRVWATIFKGAQTWAIVDVIGSSLNIYADMLEATYCY